jgi:ATP-binding cassette subfamily C protein EexD
MENTQQSNRPGLKTALWSYRKTFGFIGVISLFINLSMLVPPLYMLQVYDRVLASRSTETLVMLSLVLVWMFLTLGILEFVRSRVLVRLSTRLDHELNSRIYSLLNRLALDHPDRSSSQPLSDLASIRQFAAGNGTFAFFDSPWVPIYIGVLFLFDSAFGWFALFAAVVLTILAVVNELSTRKLQAQANDLQTQANYLAGTQLRNAEVVHAMGMEKNLLSRWLEKHRASVTAQCEASDRAGVWLNLSKTLRLTFQSLMLGLGAWLAINGQITAGMVIAGSILMGRALSPIDQMIGAWKGFTNARHSFHRLDKLLTAVPKQKRRLSLPTPKGAIKMENGVLIPPGGDTPVLKGVSFQLRAGEMLAIVGSSAAGKSSLIRAILGLWSLNAGRVQLDGADMKQWNRDELGKWIGYLPQDVELFDGTVAENIARFGKPNDRRVVNAARIAGVDEMIRALPQGYDTQIGVGGQSLSGGQRQRIGLARAVYGRPRVVVLDEPNSNLDEDGERALSRACKFLKRHGVTLVLVSHRRSILQRADKILALDAGRLQAFGPRDAVLDHLYGPMERLRRERSKTKSTGRRQTSKKPVRMIRRAKT